jgi:hypothetical protein
MCVADEGIMLNIPEIRHLATPLDERNRWVAQEIKLPLYRLPSLEYADAICRSDVNQIKLATKLCSGSA